MEALDVKRTPKLTISYDPNKSQCHSESEFRYPSIPTYNGMCFRLQITNIGSDTVSDCEAHLTEVYYEGEEPELGPMKLTWAAMASEVTSLDVIANVPAYLNVLVITQAGQLKVCSVGWPHNRGNFFSRRGFYVFTIVVSAKNSATLPPYRLRLNFDGDWRTSSIEPLNQEQA